MQLSYIVVAMYLIMLLPISKITPHITVWSTSLSQCHSPCFAQSLNHHHNLLMIQIIVLDLQLSCFTCLPLSYYNYSPYLVIHSSYLIKPCFTLSHSPNTSYMNHATNRDHSTPRVMPYFVASSLQHIWDSSDHLPVWTSEIQMLQDEHQNPKAKLQGPNTKGQTLGAKHPGPNAEGQTHRPKCWGSNAKGIPSWFRSTVQTKCGMENCEPCSNPSQYILYTNYRHFSLSNMPMGFSISLNDCALHIFAFTHNHPIWLTIKINVSYDYTLILKLNHFPSSNPFTTTQLGS